MRPKRSIVCLGSRCSSGAYSKYRDRVRGTDRERGDVVQWVILAAIGAAIAITVGTIIFNKVRDKANTITTDTPAANTGP